MGIIPSNKVSATHLIANSKTLNNYLNCRRELKTEKDVEKLKDCGSTVAIMLIDEFGF